MTGTVVRDGGFAERVWAGEGSGRPAARIAWFRKAFGLLATRPIEQGRSR